jgi:hypothetical protein
LARDDDLARTLADDYSGSVVPVALLTDLSLQEGDVSSDQQAAKLLVGIGAHDGQDIGQQSGYVWLIRRESTESEGLLARCSVRAPQSWELGISGVRVEG